MLFPHQLCLFQRDLPSSGPREALFLLHSPLSCSLLLLHSKCTQLSPGLHPTSVFTCFYFSFPQQIQPGVQEGIVLFLEQSSHRHTGVTVLLKNSSGRRYSHLLPLFLSCKLQMTSPFKAGSFLKNKINIAGLLVHLIVFYLSTQRLVDD